MAVTYGFFNSVNGDRKYDADQMTEFFRGIVNEGVFQHLDGGLAVTAGTGLAVSVAAGRAIIQNRWVQNSAALSLSIAAASETYGRKDAVVIRYNISARSVSITVKTGTPAASPAAPSLTRNSTTYEMALAYVNVSAGASSVTVTDKRSDTTVCGWATVAQQTSGEVDAMLNAMKTGFDGVSYPTPAEQVIGSDTKLKDRADFVMDEVQKYADNGVRRVSFYYRGDINGTTIRPSITNRVYSDATVFDHKVIVKLKDPASWKYKICKCDSAGNITQDGNFVKVAQIVDANQTFRVCIIADPEQSGTPANIATFSNQIQIETAITTQIEAIQKENAYTAELQKVVAPLRVSRNLLDPSTYHENTLLSWQNGTTSENSDYVTWEYIPVKDGATLFFSRGLWNDTLYAQNPAALCCYDKDKSFLANIGNKSTVPYGTKYISICIGKGYVTEYNMYLEYDKMTMYEPWFAPFYLSENVRNPFINSIAHQGYNLFAPNQTMAAYKAAKEYGFRYVEMDFKVTSDGKIICCHNETVYADDTNKVICQTLQSASGAYTTALTIADTTLATLKEYSWGAWKSSEYASETVLEFEDLLKYCKFNGLTLVLDHVYTVIHDADAWETVTSLIDQYGMRDHVIVGSIDANVGTWNPAATIMHGGSTYDPGYIQTLLNYLASYPKSKGVISIPYDQCTTEIAKAVHEAGLELSLWTIDKVADIKTSAAMADYITSNWYMVEDALQVLGS